MLKVGDKVKYKYGYGLGYSEGYGEVIEVIEVIEVDIEHYVDYYKIESKINDVVIYRPRNKLSKIIMICAGIF